MSIPNILTIIRICLMPMFLTFYLSPIDNGKNIALVILIISFLTDVLDGFIARKFNMITDLGKVLDPLADKLMQVAVLLCIAFEEKYLALIVAFIFIKEILLAIGAFILYKQKRKIFSSNWFGKASCFLSVVCSIVLMFRNMFFSPVLIEYICSGVIIFVNTAAFISYLMVYINAKNAKAN